MRIDINRQFRAAQSLISLFALGGLYAMAVFTVPVDDVLPGVWATSIGVMHWLSAPVTILVGLRLHSVKNASTVRMLGILSAMSYSMFALAAYALTVRNSFLVRLAICFQALPLGINYVLHCENLVRWFPRTPGFIVGCGLVAYNGGTIVLSWVFSQLINGADIVSALYKVAAILTFPSLFPALFLSFPSGPILSERTSSPLQERAAPAYEYDNYTDDICESVRLVNLSSASSASSSASPASPASHATTVADEEEEATLRSSVAGVRRIAKERNFWLYVGTILSTGAPYALLPFFFKVGAAYGLGVRRLMVCFQVVGAVGTALALFSGILIDVLTTSVHRSGARRLLVYTLILQIVLFLLLSCGERNDTWVFYAAACTLVVLTNAHYGCAAVLARDAFGARDAALAFGVGGGLSIGTGEGLSVQIMALAERLAANSTNTAITKSTYVPCFLMCTVWTVVGLACAYGIDVNRL